MLQAKTKEQQLLLPFEENRPKWHKIYRIKPDGEREFAASYDGKFSAYYAMQLWWCNLHHCNFFCKQSLQKATKQIATSKSMRSVMFDFGKDTYILSVPKGSNVMIGECRSKYEYNIKTMI